MFITIDGIDGCGKSTLTTNVVATLRARGQNVVHTREPYIAETRNRIARGVDPFVALSLFLIDRAHHVADVIAPNQENMVITDRYGMSTAAYQGYLLQDRLPDAVNSIWQMNNTLFPRPDRAYLVDVPIDVALARIRRRPKTDVYEHREMLTRVRDNFLTVASCDPTIQVIDGTQPPDVLCQFVCADILMKSLQRDTK
jgi:dTMP kinase